MPGMRRAFFFVFCPLAPASGGRGPPDQVGLIQPRPNAISPRPEPHRPSPVGNLREYSLARRGASPRQIRGQVRALHRGALEVAAPCPRLKPPLRAVFSASWPTTLEPEFRTRIVIERKTRGSVMQTEGLAKKCSCRKSNAGPVESLNSTRCSSLVTFPAKISGQFYIDEQSTTLKARITKSLVRGATPLG